MIDRKKQSLIHVGSRVAAKRIRLSTGRTERNCKEKGGEIKLHATKIPLWLGRESRLINSLRLLCQTMKLAITILVVLLVAIGLFVAFELEEHVHSERWRVKTLGDSLQIDTIAVQSSIDKQSTIPSPKVDEDVKRQKAERTVFTVHADLVELKRELDNDYHLVLRDRTSGKMMIAEIPDGDNEAPLQYRKSYMTARHVIESLVGPPGRFMLKLPKPIPIVVTGIGFFDEPHFIAQTGMAPNNREIHPVLKIELDSARSDTIH